METCLGDKFEFDGVFVDTCLGDIFEFDGIVEETCLGDKFEFDGIVEETCLGDKFEFDGIVEETCLEDDLGGEIGRRLYLGEGDCIRYEGRVEGTGCNVDGTIWEELILGRIGKLMGFLSLEIKDMEIVLLDVGDEFVFILVVCNKS